MTKYTTVFASLLRHFSRSDFQSAIQHYKKADFKVRVLNCYDLFKTMLYGLISNCFSVREIETSMRVNGNRLYHTGLKQIKRSTFCDALEKRPNGLFENVFTELVGKAQAIAGKTHKKFTNPLRIIDATIIPLCLSMFNWAKYRKAKGAVKVHLNLDGDNCIPFDAYLSNGKIHEADRMQNLTLESGVIYVMDRGYIDFKSLYSIELQNSTFVSRMKTNCAYRKIKNNPCSNNGSVLSDVLIELTGLKTKEHYPEPLRKIKYQDPETKKVYEFLTNDMERDAEEVAQIYKERWEVELFFKWIKQHLKIKSFWGTSMNAVYSQIWVALILTILIWISRTLDGITVSPHELLIMMRSTLLTKNSLMGLCTNITQSKIPDFSCQPFLEGFIC